METIARENGRAGVRLEEEAIAKLTGYGWPGNVRELMCVIERLIVFTDADTIGERDVDKELARIRSATAGKEVAAEEPRSDRGSLAERRLDAEREAVLDALRRAGQNRTRAARLLGVSRRTLYKRLDALGIGSSE